jgi:outer membrane protein TolC
VGLPDVRLTTPGLPAQTPEPEAGLEAAVASRADVESRRAARRALVAGADAERAASLPRVDLVAGLDVATPAPRAFAQSELRALATWDLGVRVSFSLERALAAFSRAERLEREADVLVAEEDATLRDARLEIATARAEHAALGAARATALASLEAAEELAAARTEQLRAGLVTVSQVALAEAAVLRARLDESALRAELRVAHVRALEAAGLRR